MGVNLDKIQKWKEKGKVTKLLKATKHKSKEIRVAAILAMGTAYNNDAINELIAFLRDEDPDIRGAAVESLGNIGNARASEFVRNLSTTDADENVRLKASEAFKKIKQVAASEV